MFILAEISLVNHNLTNKRGKNRSKKVNRPKLRIIYVYLIVILVQFGSALYVSKLGFFDFTELHRNAGETCARTTVNYFIDFVYLYYFYKSKTSTYFLRHSTERYMQLHTYDKLSTITSETTDRWRSQTATQIQLDIIEKRKKQTEVND